MARDVERGSTTSYQQYTLLERDPGTGGGAQEFDSRNSTSQLACANGNQYATDVLCRRAVDFLAADTTDPFFLLFATTSPHLPAPVSLAMVEPVQHAAASLVSESTTRAFAPASPLAPHQPRSHLPR